MAFTCHRLLEPDFVQRGLKLRGGAAGLDGHIHWFHALESLDEVAFLQSHELVFLTGIALGNDSDKLLQLLKGIVDQKAAGMVINVGKYIPDIPVAVTAYADACGVPLFELPWEVKLGEVTHKLGELLLEERLRYKNVQGLVKKILFSDGKTTESSLDTALLYDMGLAPCKQVMVIGLPDLMSGDQQRLQTGLEILFQEMMAAYEEPCLFTWNGNEILFILSEFSAVQDPLPGDLRQKMQQQFSLRAFIGLGGAYTRFIDLRNSHREAHFALRMAAKLPERSYIDYRQTNVFRLFDRVGDMDFLQQYYEAVLGKLLLYDQKNKSDFTHTLEVYLEENEDTAAVIKRLFIHRNTLTYRLKRIEEILGCSMADSETRLNVRIAFKMRSFLELMQND